MVEIIRIDGKKYKTDELLRFWTPKVSRRVLRYGLISQFCYRICLICGANRFTDQEWSKGDLDMNIVNNDLWICTKESCHKVWIRHAKGASKVIYPSGFINNTS